MKKFFLAIIALFVGYIIVFSILGSTKFESVKKLISKDNRNLIKQYIFPHKYIKELDIIMKIEREEKNFYKGFVYYHDLAIKKSKESLVLKKDFSLDKDNININIYNFTKNKIQRGINADTPGSGYLDYYKDKLFFVSSIGITAFAELNPDQLVFKQIENNIPSFVKVESLRKGTWFSIKDTKVFDEKIYVSYTNEIKDDCWNTSIIYADLNFEKLSFKKFFDPGECIHSKHNEDAEFNPHQSGGRIFKFDDNHIMLTTGDYRSRAKAQLTDNSFGKILKIDSRSGDYEILSMGHRNPQGLFFNKKENFLISTENGPFGGDEINLIDLNSKEIKNYGWAISSYGDHYPGRTEEVKKKYPLYNSHSEHGFIEPLKWFTPALGISEIIQIDVNKYLFAGMRAQAIFTFVLNENNELVDLQEIKIGQRVRDVAFNDDTIFLFLETNSSIAIVKGLKS